MYYIHNYKLKFSENPAALENNGDITVVKETDAVNTVEEAVAIENFIDKFMPDILRIQLFYEILQVDNEIIQVFNSELLSDAIKVDGKFKYQHIPK